MKKVILVALMSLFLFGCGTIKQQQNISKIMATHVIEGAAADVYKAAEEEFKGMYVPLISNGKYKGATAWLTKHSTLGSKKYMEKDRFVVVVTTPGKGQSKVVVTRELQSDFNGSWSTKPTARMHIYEFNIQKRLNPGIAQEIETKASQM